MDPTGATRAAVHGGLANTTTVSTLTFYEWILSDVFLAFPGSTRVVRGGIGWMPHALEHADTSGIDTAGGPALRYRRRRRRTSRITSTRFIDDIFGAQHLREIGVDNVMLETDFPHSDSATPNTMKMAEERFAYPLTTTLVEGDAAECRGRVFRLDVPTRYSRTSPRRSAAARHL